MAVGSNARPVSTDTTEERPKVLGTYAESEARGLLLVAAILFSSVGGCSSGTGGWKNEVQERVQSAIRQAFGEVVFDKPGLAAMTVVSDEGNAQNMSITGQMTVTLANGEARAFEYKAQYVVREADKTVAMRLLMIGREYAFHHETDTMSLPTELEALVKVKRIELDGSEFP